MGEVYRGRDTRLDRTVAIKILPVQFSSDPIRKQLARNRLCFPQPCLVLKPFQRHIRSEMPVVRPFGRTRKCIEYKSQRNRDRQETQKCTRFARPSHSELCCLPNFRVLPSAH